MTAKKRQEEKHLQVLKTLQQAECNKKCFECDQRGPTYVDVTIGSFVCTSCGGILRGLNPPHRIKSVSMATFTPAEIAFIETRGNELCKHIYLGRYDSNSRPRPDPKDHAKLKYFMEQKYEQKRWYVSPEQALKVVESSSKFNEIATSKPEPLSNLLGNNAPQLQLKNSPKSPKVDNILADFGSSAPTSVTGTQSATHSGFADFGNAFSSQTSDAFGDFTSGFNSADNAATKTDEFADFSNFVSPTVATTNVNVPQPTSKPIDKYADLGDLFSSDNLSSNNTGMWSAFGSTSTSNTSTSVFDLPKPQHNTSLQTTNLHSQGSVFGSQQPAVFGNAFPQKQQQNIFGTQQTTALSYGNLLQPGISTSQNQTGNVFSMQQSVGNILQPNQTLFRTPQQSNVSSAFGSYFPNQPAFSLTSQMSTVNSNMSQPFTSPATTAGNMANPFMQQQTSIPPSGMTTQILNNPFMIQQQTQKPFAAPASSTNPFMNNPNVAPAQMSTNPFF